MLQTDSPEDEFTDEKRQEKELMTELMRFCMLVEMQDVSKVTVYDSPLMQVISEV
jgi:hypothetical protein